MIIERQIGPHQWEFDCFESTAKEKYDYNYERIFMNIQKELDKDIRNKILQFLESYGGDKYDVCNNAIVAEIQNSRPRCADGCICEASRNWRDKAIYNLFIHFYG